MLIPVLLIVPWALLHVESRPVQIDLPSTVVTIRQPGIWRLDRRIWPDVDPSQGSWIAGGLSEWAERPRP